MFELDRQSSLGQDRIYRLAALFRRDLFSRIVAAASAAPFSGTKVAFGAKSAENGDPQAIARSLARVDFGTSVVSVVSFGATGDGATDCSAAFWRAHDAMKDGEVLYIPPGRYALSETFRFSRMRSVIVCQGTLIPWGPFDDFLMEIVNIRAGGDDDFISDLGITCLVSDLNFDGLYQARGLRLVQVYNSLLHRVAVWRCSGKAIDIDYCFENVWIAPVISGCIGRPTESAPAAWEAAAAYETGDLVECVPNDFSDDVAYTVGSIVRRSGKTFQAIENTNPGEEPGKDIAQWAQMPARLFRALRTNNASNPLCETGLSSSTGFINLDWVETISSEPALGICNTIGYETVDHQYFYGLCVRHCFHTTLINIDVVSGSRKAVNIEFHGAQIHAPVREYASRAKIPAWSNLPRHRTLVRLGRSTRTKLLACNLRSAEFDDVTLLALGGYQASREVEEVIISACNFSGEGRGLIGCHVMPSVRDRRLVISDTTMDFTQSDNSRKVVDLTGAVVSQLVHDVIPAVGHVPITATHFIKIADTDGHQYLIPAIRT